MKNIAFTFFIAVSAVLVQINFAHADQIDGKWCSLDGKSLNVNFTDVTTPGGNKVKANYNRHHIDFIIPAGEEDEGSKFGADQMNDNQIRVTITEADGESRPPNIWAAQKCKDVTS